MQLASPLRLIAELALNDFTQRERQPAFPSNPIIHPREQLDWGEPDDRWTVSPDCADLIEERVQALMGRRPLVKGEGKS